MSFRRIVDTHGSWRQTWNKQFNAICITPELRSLMNGLQHDADPAFIHRSLECYAEMMRRKEELITMIHELTQRDNEFNGPYPYQTPSNSVFHDFHQ
jgi:hypothetical protein